MRGTLTRCLGGQCERSVRGTRGKQEMSERSVRDDCEISV